MSTSILDLNLDYDFQRNTETDNVVLNSLTQVKNGLMKEIIETFGEDMGDVNLKRNFNTKFDIEKDPTRPEISNPKHDDLILGILRFAKVLGLDNFNGDGKWARAVIEVADWYVHNVHAYSQPTLSFCPLVMRNVRWDCSGFTTTCLWRYGALKDIMWPPASAAYTNDSNIAQKLQEAGFEKMTFSWDTVQAFDIITYPGHVEIYNGIKDGKHSSWAWGACHDVAHGGLPCATAHQKQGYDVIWRNKYNGTSSENMDELNFVTAQISAGQTRANALIVISMLMKDCGLSKAQAAGVAGVMTAESGVNPKIYNKGEKSGKYKSSGANNEGAPYGNKHCPWSYGAGICQWTFTDRKEKAIMGGLGVSKQQAVNIIMHGGIESLSLEQQVKMLEYELRTTYKYTFEGLKKCTSAQQAAATFYCHAIGGYSTSTNPATQQEINKKNAAYSKVGAKSQINKGMAYAEGYMR